MKTRHKGIIVTMLSAFIFGFTPILARLTYDGGANGITLTFLRASLSLPILLVIMKRCGIPLRLKPGQGKGILITGTLGASMATLTLYLSYNYISVGMATTLHFIYPVLVSAGSVFLFKERINKGKLCALLAGSCGVLMFAERGSSAGSAGLVLALLSGGAYAFYIIGIDRLGLKEIHFFKLSFYLCGITSVVSGVFGLITGTLVFRLTPEAWAMASVISVLTSVFALSLFQVGIAMTGGATAAILSILEPITSIVLGILILHEKLTTAKLLGCVFIIVSVILIMRAGTSEAAECGREIRPSRQQPGGPLY